jgi:hypothetical protein
MYSHMASIKALNFSPINSVHSSRRHWKHESGAICNRTYFAIISSQDSHPLSALRQIRRFAIRPPSSTWYELPKDATVPSDILNHEEHIADHACLVPELSLLEIMRRRFGSVLK